MIRKASLLLVASLSTTLAMACPVLPAAKEVPGKHEVSLYYQLTPEDIQPGAPFSLNIWLCHNEQTLADIKQLKFNATMPAHGHGMNYSADIANPKPGQYAIRHLLLHMPGLWQFEFDIAHGSYRQTLTFNVQL